MGGGGAYHFGYPFLGVGVHHKNKLIMIFRGTLIAKVKKGYKRYILLDVTGKRDGKKKTIKVELDQVRQRHVSIFKINDVVQIEIDKRYTGWKLISIVLAAQARKAKKENKNLTKAYDFYGTTINSDRVLKSTVDHVDKNYYIKESDKDKTRPF